MVDTNKNSKKTKNKVNYSLDTIKGKQINSEQRITEKKLKKSNTKYTTWCIKITIITVFLTVFFSFLSELTSSVSSIVATILLLFLLLVLSIIFDGIAVSVTTCKQQDFLNFVKNENTKYVKIGKWLIANQEKVANICADVVGDIFSIVSGSCSVAIIMELTLIFENLHEQIATIIISSIVAGLTVGGKAFMKKIAMKNCNSYILMTAKIINIFTKGETNGYFRKHK